MVKKGFTFADLEDFIRNETLSREQINKVITLLSEKESSTKQAKKVRKELSEKETLFLQCCRDNRIYDEEKDDLIMVCPYCESIHIKKNGFRRGKQNYFCNDCGKSFIDNIGTVVYRSKLPFDKLFGMIVFILLGKSCRWIARNLKVNKNTVLYHRHRIGDLTSEYVLNRDSFPSMVESDECYYPLLYKDVKNPMFFIETLGRMPYTRGNRT